MRKRLFILALCIVCLFGLTACTDTHEGATNLSSKYVHLKVAETVDDRRMLVESELSY